MPLDHGARCSERSLRCRSKLSPSRLASGPFTDASFHLLLDDKAQVCHGKPCIRGLRYAVTMLLELMSSGMSHDEVLADYEDLYRDDLLAALTYAARLSDAKRIALA